MALFLSYFPERKIFHSSFFSFSSNTRALAKSKKVPSFPPSLRFARSVAEDEALASSPPPTFFSFFNSVSSSSNLSKLLISSLSWESSWVIFIAFSLPFQKSDFWVSFSNSLAFFLFFAKSKTVLELEESFL